MELLQSPLRVLDPGAADIIYVPFYVIALASGHVLTHCSPELTPEDKAQRIAEFWAESPQLLPLLGSKPHWLVRAPSWLYSTPLVLIVL